MRPGRGGELEKGALVAPAHARQAFKNRVQGKMKVVAMEHQALLPLNTKLPTTEKTMKNRLTVVATLACLGIGVAVALTSGTGRRLVANRKEGAAVSNNGAAGGGTEREGKNAEQPTAYCANPDYDFGLMNPLTVESHVFTIENRGSVPLILEGGETTCKCTLSDLKHAIVEPGGSYAIELTWNSGNSQPNFAQSATVRTNDPTSRELLLTVSGEVKAVLASLPSVISMDQLLPEKRFTTRFTLYSQTWEDFEIVRVETTNDHFSAKEYAGGIPQFDAMDEELQSATVKKSIEMKYDGLAERGQLSGYIRIFVRPPPDWRESVTHSNVEQEFFEGGQQAFDSEDLPGIGFPIQEDGTVLAEVAFDARVIRRVSLYGNSVRKDGSISLGTIRSTASMGSRWNMIGRVRGELVPGKVVASVEGIPGLMARVESKESDRAAYTFGLTLEITKPLKPASYNAEQAGWLRVEAIGLPENDGILELPIHLIVVQR